MRFNNISFLQDNFILMLFGGGGRMPGKFNDLPNTQPNRKNLIDECIGFTLAQKVLDDFDMLKKSYDKNDFDHALQICEFFKNGRVLIDKDKEGVLNLFEKSWVLNWYLARCSSNIGETTNAEMYAKKYFELKNK